MARVLYAIVGWMKWYEGNRTDDHIVGGGSWLAEDKHEQYNFLDLDGYCYGYVQTPGEQLNLKRIDGISGNTDYLDDVLVVWCAADAKNKQPRKVIGWYHNARVYASYQTDGDKRRQGYDYNIKAKTENCVLLPLEDRKLTVPHGNKGESGQSLVWYADSEAGKAFVEKTLKFIERFESKGDTHKDWIVGASNGDVYTYEGGAKKVLINSYERSRANRDLCIKAHGCKCVVCGFDFEKVYGEIGKGFIHVHHTKLVSQMKDKTKPDINDLVPVCPNCHAMLHHGSDGKVLSVDELKKLLHERQTRIDTICH